MSETNTGLHANAHLGRPEVEAQMGPAVADAFDRHSDFVVTDPATGNQSLHMQLPQLYRGGIQELDLNRSTDADTGVETTTMVYSNGGRSYGSGYDAIVFTQGGDEAPSIVPALRDPKTGKVSPRVPKGPDDIYFQDGQIAIDGQQWLRNLDPETGAIPEIPRKRNRIIAAIARWAMRSSVNPGQ